MSTAPPDGLPTPLSVLDAAIFESSPDCVKLLDLDGRLLAMNRNGICAMEVEDFSAIAGAPWKSLWPAAAADTIETALQQARQGASGRFEAACPTAKGTPKWWEVVVTPIRGLDGAIGQVLSVSRDITAARDTLARLHAGEARYRSLVAATAAIVWSGPAHGEFETEQEGWSAYTGQSFAQYRGWGWLDAVHPDDRADTSARWRQAVAGAAIFEAEHRLRRADGVYRHMSVRAAPVLDEHGAIREWVGMHTDITPTVEANTERERLLGQIQAANELMGDVFRQAPAFMCVLTGPEHIYAMVNQRYRELTGREDLPGKPVRYALPELAEQGIVALLDRVYASGQPYAGVDIPLRLRRDGGGARSQHYIDFSCTPLRDGAGRVSGILVHGVDQTDRKLAEIALFESKERYRTLFTSVDEGFCVIEMRFGPAGEALDYTFLEMNPAFERHTGLSGATGHSARELVPQLDQFWFDTYGAVARTGQPIRFEHRADAMGRWFDVYATRLGGDGSAKVALLFSDITERKRADEHLRTLAADLAESDRRKTEFLATLAHELRNPLAPIRSGLALLRMGPDAAAAARIHGILERQVGNMVHLIDDLLDIARISGGKLELRKERVALQAVLAGAVETSLPLIEAGRHQLTESMPEHPLLVDADPTRIGQVVANLLNNAAKYTPAGGRIDLALRQEGQDAVIAVRDSGIGLPPDSLESVFDMFNQIGRHTDRSQGGLGIGLSLVRRLTRMHGGSVTAHSAGPGRGSTFTVRLPLAAADAAGGAQAAVGAPSPRPGRAMRVLVVDDNRDAGNALGMLLEAGGHAVQVAHDGSSALRAAAEFMPQVVFLDIGMPGMDGYQTARALRSDTRAEPMVLVALTGWGADSDRRKSRHAGLDQHLTKPADAAAVHAILAQAGKDG